MRFLTNLLWPRASSHAAQPTSKHVAKERLKLALTYDRSGLAHDTIERLRDEIIELIAKHLAVRADDIQINVDRTAEGERLIASIPLQGMPRPRLEVARAAPTAKPAGRRRRRKPRPAN